MSRLLTLTTLFAAGACLAAPAFAQTAATPPAAAAAATPATPAVAAPAPTAPVAAVPAAPKTAAKEKVTCEEEEVIGSRLGGHRVCKTASAWAEERRAAREEIERSQNNRGVGGPNG